ncbi:ATP-binding protein [Corallococcus interemptor]|uniref:ATP-binding protein n=1 Tax=Corallococcus interemptor TaxID=2316720 RepID=A0A3A8QTZ5_9BACT|nr:ATP-binding protein [Corallococcus interemptor]RKH70350.1 ATP-binding protein [Corallococcus interemptor]
MLIEFRLENHRSVQDEQVLTMEAGRIGTDGDPRLRVIQGHSEPLLPVAAVYGANASGKSNVVSGIEFMRNAVVHSHRAWPPEGGVPRDPFAWGIKSQEPSLFEVTFVNGEIRYQYGFVADDDRFLEEWLHAWPHGRKQVLFEREGDNFKFGEHLHGENKLVEQVTRPNALFLSAAAQNRHDQLTPLYGWFRQVRVANLGVRRRTVQDVSETWLSRSMTPVPTTEQQELSATAPVADDRIGALRALLQAADVGIVDLKVSVEEDDGSSVRARRARRVRLFLQHQAGNDDAWLPLEEESQGTLTLVRLAPHILETLWTGGVLVVDELEASLHPLLGLHIVRQFNDSKLNPKNAQLVFTTHDTNLLGTTLGEAPLRRDQIWLAEKDESGTSRIYPLTDYKPRKEENLERGYLQGRYGAIPFLGEIAPVKE